MCQINVIHVECNIVDCGHTCGQTGRPSEQVHSETQGNFFYTVEQPSGAENIISDD